MKIICNNGNTVESWYDSRTHSWVTQVRDANGNQVGDANYSGNRDTQRSVLASRVGDNGGQAGV